MKAIHAGIFSQNETKKYDRICKKAYDEAPKIVPYHRDWLDSPWKGKLPGEMWPCTCDVNVHRGFESHL